MNELFAYPEGKTNYQILNEDGEKTTITLDKWVADILQLELNDVHHRIQIAYDKVLQEKPELGRIQRGNYVRRMAEVTANKYQESKKKVLGWNDQDMLDSI
jgi:hypothetical protein